MTRINCVPPSVLNMKHLGAAWNETPRIITEVEALLAKGTQYDDYVSKIPSEYVFGKGHNTFFYNKLHFIRDYLAVVQQEGIRRGFNYDIELMISYTRRIRKIEHIDHRWCGDWQPTQDDMYLNMARLVENHFSPGFHVDGRSIIKKGE